MEMARRIGETLRRRLDMKANRVTRGGTFNAGGGVLLTAFRQHPTVRTEYIGFRCARP